MSANSTKARQYVWLAYAFLFLMVLISGIIHFLNDSAQITAVIIRLLPLVLFIPTLLQHRAKRFIWLAVLGFLYLLQDVLLLTQQVSSLWVYLELLAAVLLSATAINYVLQQRKTVKLGGNNE